MLGIKSNLHVFNTDSGLKLCDCVQTDRESRLGGLVLMGVSSSELLSSSSDSSDWISSTMDLSGPEKREQKHKTSILSSKQTKIF